MNASTQILTVAELDRAGYEFWNSQVGALEDRRTLCLVHLAALRGQNAKRMVEIEQRLGVMHGLALRRRDAARKRLNGFSNFL